MKICTIFAIGALIVAMGATAARADDCNAQYTADQRQIYSSLSPANQHILDTEIKKRNGEAVSCDFKRGVLDLLANFQPQNRDAGFKQLLEKQLNH